MKTISICGKITNATPEEISLFHEVESRLKFFGYSVFNPVILSVKYPGETWEFYMEICIKKLIQNKKAVFLPNYKESKGALLEYHICKQLNYEIWELDKNLYISN